MVSYNDVMTDARVIFVILVITLIEYYSGEVASGWIPGHVTFIAVLSDIHTARIKSWLL